jgi:hypothetical protein
MKSTSTSDRFLFILLPAFFAFTFLLNRLGHLKEMKQCDFGKGRIGKKMEAKI